MTSPDYITHEEIRQRAREIWVRSGEPEGRDVDHWLAAETALQQERESIPEASVRNPAS